MSTLLYLALKLHAKYKSVTMNALTEFWSDYKDTFPVLALVARFVLSVPASSAKSESVFSDAGTLAESVVA